MIKPMQPIEVMRGTHSNLALQFGPFAGFRYGNAVAYDFELPERFEPWPGRTRLERVFVLLDLGISFANPLWVRQHKADGSIVEVDPSGQGSWYVDLIKIEVQGNRYIFRDLYIDVIVPTDGRHYRMLDLDDYAEAMTNGELTMPDAIDGLHRWQRFLDRHLHAERWPSRQWSDFPPRCISELAALPTPFAIG